MKRKFCFAFFLTIVIVFLIPCTVFAEVWYKGSAGPNISYTYEVFDGGGYVLTLTGDGDMYDDITWFYGQSYHTEYLGLQIGKGITSIGDYAFDGMNIQGAYLPESITRIGEGAFSNCNRINGLDQASSYYIPKNVSIIEDYAFLATKSINAFDVASANQYYCDVDGVLYTKDMTTLVQYPCGKADVDYTVPKTVTKINPGALWYCSSLQNIYVEEGNSSYTSIDGVLFSKDKKTLICYPSNREESSYIIPECVTAVSERAFYECNCLESVRFPEGFQVIKNDTFERCDLLSTIYMPKSLTFIQANPFPWCDISTIYYFGNSSTWSSILPSTWSSTWREADVYYILIGEAVSPTCHTDGHTAYEYYESYYGDVIVTPAEVIPATGEVIIDWVSIDENNHKIVCECGWTEEEPHDWDSGTIRKEPTHLDYGERVYTCPDCEAIKKEQVDKTATHSYGVWTKVDTDIHQRVCECGDIEVKDHNWDEGVVVEEASYSDDGKKMFTCMECTTTKSEIIPAGVEITEENFPDSDFRKYLANKFDENNDEYFTLAEIEKIKMLDLKGRCFHNLTGLEFFTCLENLDCRYNYIDELDISGNPNLQYLYCGQTYSYFDSISSLDVSNNPLLKELHCYETQIAELDVSNNYELEVLVCYRTQINAINVSKNKKLKLLKCFDTDITVIDVSENINLEELDCAYTKISSLNVSGNPSLQDLCISNTSISDINLKSNPLLKKLSCRYTNISLLDVSENIQLTYLDIAFCPNVVALDLTNNVNLKTVWLNNGKTNITAEHIATGWEFDLKDIVGVKNIGNIVSVSSGEYNKVTGVVTFASVPSVFRYIYDTNKGNVGGTTFNVIVDVIAEDHTEIIDEAVSPTCSQTGLTEGKYCLVCNQVLLKQEVVDTIAHSYGTWTKVDAENHQRTCVCGDIETEAHNWNNGTITTQPTHATFGERTYTCEDCSDTKTEQVGKTTEHTYGFWSKVDNGTHKRTCDCGDIDTTDHRWNNGVETTPATETTTGIRTHTCMDCSATKEEIIPKISYKLSGVLTSFGSSEDFETTLQLILDGENEPAYEIKISGTGNKDYSFSNVLVGTYTLRVIKTKHCTREYRITVTDADVAQNVEIWLYGDVTGDGLINMTDAAQIKRKHNGIASIFGSGDAATEEYRLLVANVYADDGVINITDATQIKRHYNGLFSIFDSLP